jgi:hypothetical protein
MRLFELVCEPTAWLRPLTAPLEGMLPDVLLEL